MALAAGFALAAALAATALQGFAEVNGTDTLWSVVSLSALGALGAGVASHRLTGGRFASLAVAAVTVVFTAGWLLCILAFSVLVRYPPGN